MDYNLHNQRVTLSSIIMCYSSYTSMTMYMHVYTQHGRGYYFSYIWYMYMYMKSNYRFIDSNSVMHACLSWLQFLFYYIYINIAKKP